ncbi:MAG: hypothetical protein IM490_05740 [Microcystis sp. M054S2]|uniref:hypothetical protein n=1 Tax=unclassified Microcystis TaxID=2643300 RepID=UPI0025854DAA|nr:MULTISPECIES: hypothetical protein [unclassified Microcystis]MCA2815501.1 hypothetical protein [Microcystis sp. M085S1]MCA2857279.1 hypothetical protein [Microcystis sp. M065S1]MCA2885833.1 hypothetical protein [Microcystis sp. M043S1]MCA2664518.1 hypothetical protein [Microcystis sp. M064S2]MCA2674936.1 hypothetical protein [Microcystis sp. M054S2]
MQIDCSCGFKCDGEGTATQCDRYLRRVRSLIWLLLLQRSIFGERTMQCDRRSCRVR